MSLSRAASEDTPRRLVALAAAGILLGAVVAYANSLGAPLVFDDGAAVAAAANWMSVVTPAADAGETTSGRPLLALTLALDHAISGPAGWSYRVTNLLVHGLAGLTLFGITRRTLRRVGTGGSTVCSAGGHDTGRASLATAFFLAVLWTLHPLQTQAVTYLVQRAESLAGLFFLLTLYLFVRSADSPHRRRWQTLSVLSCFLGMATKEVMAAAPLLVLLYDRTIVSGSIRAAWRDRQGYYLGLAASWLVLAASVLATQGRGGTAGFDTAVSASHYLLTQGHAITHYLRLAAWPHPLVFDYGTDVIREPGAVIAPGAFLVSLALATAWAVRRGSIWGFVGCLFFATLAPSSSVVPIASQTMAEHRMYLALIAPLAIGIVSLQAILGRRSVPGFALLALAGAWLTHQRNETYRSEAGLWADTVAKRPTNARAHHNLALAHFNAGQLEAAVARFEAALRLQPESADSHYNLGLCLARLGRPADAIVHYQRALATRPGHAEAHNNLGTTLLALNRAADARAHFERALHLRPGFAAAHGNMANALLRLADAPGALHHAQEALRLQPQLTDAHLHAGNACAELRRFPAALSHYEAALRLDPANAQAHNNLGNVLLESDRLSEAVSHYGHAVRLHPSYLQPRRNLGLLLVHVGRPADALPHLEAAARLAPDDVEIARALAQVSSTLRR